MQVYMHANPLLHAFPHCLIRMVHNVYYSQSQNHSRSISVRFTMLYSYTVVIAIAIHHKTSIHSSSYSET